MALSISARVNATIPSQTLGLSWNPWGSADRAHVLWYVAVSVLEHMRCCELDFSHASISNSNRREIVSARDPDYSCLPSEDIIYLITIELKLQTYCHSYRSSDAPYVNDGSLTHFV